MKKNQNFNHPKAGSCITVDPIRNLDDIALIRANLKSKPRDLALFTIGINTNLRIGDLLRLTVGQVECLQPGDTFGIRQQKRGKHGLRTVNQAVYTALQGWLEVHPAIRAAVEGDGVYEEAALFCGKDGHTAITVPYASRLIKTWCRKARLKGNFAAHTLRKTFGYHSRVTFKMPLPVITAAFGHSSQATTLSYLCIQDSEVRELFMNEL